MEYLPMGGMKAFTDLSVQLAFGEDAKPIQEGRVAAVQSLSGTGRPESAECAHSRLLLSYTLLSLLARVPVHLFWNPFARSA